MLTAFFNNIAVFLSDIQIQHLFSRDGIPSELHILVLIVVCSLSILLLVVKKSASAVSPRFDDVNTRLAKGAKGSGETLPDHEADLILNGCTDCGTCVNECAFLQEYGSPGTILKTWDMDGPDFHTMAFECSQCHLCSAVCPKGLQPGKLFHAARQQAMGSGTVSLKPYRRILEYEKLGGSPLFRFWGLPEGCNTVLFPGCTLPGTRPETTCNLFSFLGKYYSNLGIVLDCCGKPGHDLGNRNRSEKLIQELKSKGVQTILVACPSCYDSFNAYAEDMTVQTVYDVISASPFLDNAPIVHEQVVVHDPCSMRGETRTQDAVRNILIRKGFQIRPVAHQRTKTICCGEGGCAGFVRPDLADQWSRIRHDEAGGFRIITYCAGCSKFLGRVGQADHIADIVFSNEMNSRPGFRVSKGPATYLNRVRLKRRFRKKIKTKPSHFSN